MGSQLQRNYLAQPADEEMSRCAHADVDLIVYLEYSNEKVLRNFIPYYDAFQV